jgi:hypothetical protein
MNYKRLSIFFGTTSALLLMATVWLWRGYWHTEQLNNAEHAILQIEARQKNSDTVSIPSTTLNLNTISTTTRSSEHSVLRTAVSPLTGPLDLHENDINLIVPFTSQAPERNWDEPWQDACEEAAILMLDAYYKGYGLSLLSAKDELQKMIDWETAQGWGGSISMEKIKKIATDYLKIKRKISIVQDPTIDQIKKFIKDGHPVLAVADGKILPNRYYSNGGPVYHAFVIRGYTDDKFITNDPGVNRGTNFVFPVSSVMESLHDWNGGDVKNGGKVILVIE